MQAKTISGLAGACGALIFGVAVGCNRMGDSPDPENTGTAISAQTATSYSGEAKAISGTASGGVVIPNDLAVISLPSVGGPLTSTSTASVSLPPLLTTGLITGSVHGASNESTTTSTVAGLTLGESLGVSLGSLNLEATSLTSTATATCTDTEPSSSASTLLAGVVLTIGGVSYTVTGAPNQVVTLPLGIGTITFNQQSTSTTTTSATATAIAIAIDIPGVLVLNIAESTADVTCASSTTSSTTASSSGTGGTTTSSSSSGTTTSSSSTSGNGTTISSTGSTSSSSSGCILFKCLHCWHVDEYGYCDSYTTDPICEEKYGY
jgi:trimeric autotransporter adhesin